MVRRCLTLLIATTVAALAAAQGPDRSTPPKPGPAPALVLPPIQPATLQNGIPVWIAERHEVPLAEIAVVLRRGSAVDPGGKFGLASLVAAMLDEGAAGRSALEIADAVEGLGASLEAGAASDALTVSIGVPVARLRPALAVLADVVLRPTFPQRELDRLRRERLTMLLQWRDDPTMVAAQAFPRLLFGPAHRFGTTEVGTAKHLESITVEDLRAFHAAHVRPETAAMVVTGDVAPEAAQALLDEYFGAWRAPGPAATPERAPAAARPAARRIVLLDKPGAPQSEIRVGAIGVDRATPDYFPIRVLNTILGGSFTSRLNQNLRETHGYAYGAGSSFVMRKAPGPFVAAAAVQTDKTAEALIEMLKEIGSLRNPVDATELEKAKNYVALGLAGDFETTGDLAARLAEMLVFDLPRDYYDTYVARVQAVTGADVQRVAAKYLDPGKMLIVIVGDVKTVQPALAKHRLGPVSVQTLDAVLDAAAGR